MQMRLLFITSPYFYPLTASALERISPRAETKVVSYRDFDDIVQVFSRLADQFDACFVSGTSAKQAIELGVENISIPLISYQISSNGLYRDILRMAVENQSLDFTRVAMDFLIPLDTGWSVADYLALDDLPVVITKTLQRMSDTPDPGSRWLEEQIFSRLQSLWEAGKIDRVICMYSSLIPQLDALGIPWRCPFLSDFHLKQIVETAMIRIELKQLHNNHPAVIQIFPRRTAELTAQQQQTLEKHLRQFCLKNLMDFVIQSNPECCVILTSMRILRFLTDEFVSCQITSWLESRLDFPVTVAYGIGTTVSHAMNNVQIASREAKLLGLPFLVDSVGHLIGPLALGAAPAISQRPPEDVSQIARRCNLSAMTIQKLIHIVHSTGSDKITTQELAAHFGTTIRNANRIILNLCRGQVATPVYTQPSHSRGRPVQVYALDFGLSSQK